MTDHHELDYQPETVLNIKCLNALGRRAAGGDTDVTPLLDESRRPQSLRLSCLETGCGVEIGHALMWLEGGAQAQDGCAIPSIESEESLKELEERLLSELRTWKSVRS